MSESHIAFIPGPRLEDKNLHKAKTVLQETWPQPFKRSPVEDGRNVVLLPLRLAVHAVRGANAEIDRTGEELSRLRDMLESEEGY